jgi:plastocyanin
MIRKLPLVLALFAIAAFGFTACGSDSGDERAEDTEATTTTPETTGEEQAGGGAGAGGGDGGTLAIEADPNGGLEFTTGALEASAGQVAIEFDNPATVPHDVRIEDDQGEDLGGTEVIENDSASATVDLDPGEYTYFCSVPGHREAGMEDSLTVE